MNCKETPSIEKNIPQGLSEGPGNPEFVSATELSVQIKCSLLDHYPRLLPFPHLPPPCPGIRPAHSSPCTMGLLQGLKREDVCVINSNSKQWLMLPVSQP